MCFGWLCDVVFTFLDALGGFFLFFCIFCLFFECLFDVIWCYLMVCILVYLGDLGAVVIMQADVVVLLALCMFCGWYGIARW